MLTIKQQNKATYSAMEQQAQLLTCNTISREIYREKIVHTLL